MKLENVKVGETYTLKVGKNLVAVTIKGVDAKGKITVASAGGKQMTVADAGRLTVRTVADDVGRLTAKQAAHGAHGLASTSKGAKAASGRKRAQQGASEGKEKRLGLMGAAMKVLEEADQADLPMSCKKMVETAMAKGYWAPLNGGKTPVNTLAAMILRDLKEHANDAKFRRAEEHFGRGRFFLNR